MLNKKNYRDFCTSQEAYDWGICNFGEWIKRIQSGEKKDNDELPYLLYSYAGNMSILYNRFLRGFKDYSKEEFEEYTKCIPLITKELNNFALNENIIVYRYTHKNFFRFMFDSLKPQIGKTFIDKGFMSTTLVRNLLKDFAKEHNYNCILKLYLPKGTKGAYIRFNNSLLNEHEFLLPPNSKFELISKRINLDLRIRTIYECKLIGQ